MMDCIMLAVLAGCIGSIILLIGWCQKQVDKSRVRREIMIVLGIIILLLGVYLVYALLHPEKF